MDTIQDMNLEDVAEVIAYGSAAAAAAAAAKKANSPRKKKKVLDNVTETLHTDFSNQDIVISEVRRLSDSQQIKLDEEEEEEEEKRMAP